MHFFYVVTFKSLQLLVTDCTMQLAYQVGGTIHYVFFV